jgi:hypothetical protein
VKPPLPTPLLPIHNRPDLWVASWQGAEGGSQASKRCCLPTTASCGASRLLSINRDVLISVVSFLRPREVVTLEATTRELRASNLTAHLQVVTGKFRHPEQVLAQLRFCPQLQSLDLKGNRMSMEGLRTLTTFVEDGARNLERLDLSGLSIGGGYGAGRGCLWGGDGLLLYGGMCQACAHHLQRAGIMRGGLALPL